MHLEAELMIAPTPRLTGLCLWMCLFPMTQGQASVSQSLLPDTPVARVGSSTIPFVELQSPAQAKLAQQQRDFDSQSERLALSAARARDAELQSAVGNLVDEHVLALEAAALKTTPSALLAALKIPQITEAAERAFYDSRRAQANQPFESMRPQVKAYLEGEAVEDARQQYLQSLRKKYDAAVTWEPLREHVDSHGPQRGPDNAPVTIVEFSDFQCPYCARVAPVLKQLLDAYPTQVRLVFRNFPLTRLHADAAKAAEAGVCAREQGKFWEMHDALYAQSLLGETALGEKVLKENAARIGLDAKKFDECLDSGRGTSIVKADEEDGIKLALTGTPSSFVNGRFINGALPIREWRRLVDDEMGRAQLKNRETVPGNR